MSLARDVVFSPEQGRFAALDAPLPAPVPGERAWLLMSLFLCSVGVGLHFSEWDRTLFFWINSGRWLPDEVIVALGIAGLGVSVLVLSGSWAGRPAGLVSALLVAFIVGSLAVHLLKYGLDWPRPLAVLPAGSVHVAGQSLLGRSMPSGHAAVVFAWLSLVGLSAPRQWCILWGAALFAMFVAYARVAAGAHWPSDVLVGAGLGQCIGVVSARLALRAGLARRLMAPQGQWGLRLGWAALAAYLLAGPNEFKDMAPVAWLIAAAAIWSARRGFRP